MIETRYFHYFLAIAREQNITRAAESLHISQPTLSKQMMDLEGLLGCQLFIRSKKRIELTEEGMFFRARAQEMIELMDKTENTLKNDNKHITGDIYLGCGETHIIGFITEVYKKLLKNHPSIRLNLFSGDADSIMERLDKGLVDFGLLLSPKILNKYEYIPLNKNDVVGLLMKKDSPLAKQKSIPMDELYNLPLIISRQTWNGQHPIDWKGLNYKKLNIVSTYNLINNATFLVEQGIGYAFCIDKLVYESNARNLTFRPIEPTILMEIYFVSKKYQTFSPAAKLFLNAIKQEI